MKIYVYEKVVRNEDGDKLIVVETYTAQPKKFSYVIFQ